MNKNRFTFNVTKYNYSKQVQQPRFMKISDLEHKEQIKQKPTIIHSIRFRVVCALLKQINYKGYILIFYASKDRNQLPTVMYAIQYSILSVYEENAFKSTKFRN